MLQVGPEALGLESRPHGVLKHRVRLRGPHGEILGVLGDVGREFSDDCLVDEEEDLVESELLE